MTDDQQPTDTSGEPTPGEPTPGAPETPPEQPSDSADLGDAGKRALTAEREARRAAERALADLRADLDGRVKALAEERDVAVSKRDEAIGQRDVAHRAEVERIARLEKPAALWATGVQVHELLGEDGRVDASLVVKATERAVEALGARRLPEYRIDTDLAPAASATPTAREQFDAAIDAWMK
jgi:hypothetical protein